MLKSDRIEESKESKEIIEDNLNIMDIALREAKILEQSLKTEQDFNDILTLKDEDNYNLINNENIKNLSWEEKWQKYLNFCKKRKQNEILEEWCKGWNIVNKLKKEILDLQNEKTYLLRVLEDSQKQLEILKQEKIKYKLEKKNIKTNNEFRNQKVECYLFTENCSRR